MSRESFAKLPWDSDFFGFSTARISAPHLDTKNLSEIIRTLTRNQIRLAYWSVEPTDEESHEAAILCGGFLADVKLTYTLDLPTQSSLTSKWPVVPVHEPVQSEVLDGLAITAGGHSRFRIDPTFPDPLFCAMYAEWMHKSLTGERADQVMIVEAEGQTAGMLTVKQDGSTGSIGLVAVDSQYEGKGMGNALVRHAINWSADRACTQISVVTQERNLSACRLYERCGFHIEQSEHIWHFWL
jgi:dTDP-4-amino-4,6-dideoxy-D-galactose acyltransferase